MELLKILLGLLALALAWAMVFRTGLVFRINGWMKAHIFNDELALFSGRRVALLLFLLGGIALFSGIENVVEPRPVQTEVIAHLVEYARLQSNSGNYARVVTT